MNIIVFSRVFFYFQSLLNIPLLIELFNRLVVTNLFHFDIFVMYEVKKINEALTTCDLPMHSV